MHDQHAIPGSPTRVTRDDAVPDALVASNEFRAFCADVVLFVRDGSREKDIRVSASRLAMAARRNGWTSEQLIRALHDSPAYPASGSDDGTTTASYRYTSAIDRLLYAFFRYRRTGETLVPSEIVDPPSE